MSEKKNNNNGKENYRRDFVNNGVRIIKTWMERETKKNSVTRNRFGLLLYWLCFLYTGGHHRPNFNAWNTIMESFLIARRVMKI